jgi:hypothetical protein
MVIYAAYTLLCTTFSLLISCGYIEDMLLCIFRTLTAPENFLEGALKLFIVLAILTCAELIFY